MRFNTNCYTPRRLAAFAILIGFIATACSVSADSALTISSSNRCEDYSSDTSYGWQFTLNTAVTVTDLGIWDRYARFGPETPGLNESHLVTIWDSAGNAVAGALVPAGTDTTLVDVFRYVPLSPPVLLQPGTYTIGAYYSNTSGADPVAYCADPVVTAPYLSYTYSMLWYGNGPPDLYAPSESQGYFGPNFLFEPTTPPPPEIVSLSVDTTTVQKNGYATFTVARARAGNSPLVVNYSMSGTAELGIDYILDETSNQVVIPERQSYAFINLRVITTKTKGSERAVMTLKPGPGYAFSSKPRGPAPTAAVRIENK